MKNILMIIISFFITTNLLANNNLILERTTFTEKQTTPLKYEIKISYPQIKSPISTAENKFNITAKNWALNQANEFKKTLQQWQTENFPPEIKANTSTLTVDYDLAYIAPRNVISLRFNTDKYLIGAAHGSHVYNSINYDLINNKALTLSDLFNPNSNYLQYISAIMIPKVDAKLKKDAQTTEVTVFKEGLAPTSKNYDVWSLRPDGLKFTFNEYQVAAYAFGPQEITIPYQQLAKLMSNDSIISNCLIKNDCKIVVVKEEIR